MTLEELNEKVNNLIKNGYGNQTVVIRVQNPSIGPSTKCNIKGLFPGFDWDSGTIFIEPENELKIS